MTEYITILGLIAGTLTTVSFLPQVFKIYRTKQARDLSMPTWLMFFTGTILWICYGALTNSAPVVAANSITCLLCASIIIMKIKYK